jgi:aspartate kinase
MGGQPSVIEKLSVAKFGGSSIRDSFWSALKLVEYLYESSDVIVVVSALRGVTEDLLLLSATRDREVLERISHEHLRIASRVGAEVEGILEELERAMDLPKTPETEEYILSMILLLLYLKQQLYNGLCLKQTV